MRTRTRKIISLSMTILMILPFTWKAFADGSLPEDQEPLAVQSENVQPESPKEEVPDTGHEEAEAAEAPAAAESAEPAAAEILSVPETEEHVVTEIPEVPEADEPAASEADSIPEAADKPEPEYTDTESDNDEPVTEAVPAAFKAASAPETAGVSTVEADVVSKAGTAKTINVNGTSIDGSEDCSGSGWTYEKDSGRIVLRDYTAGADITSDGTGVEIVSTGYNRIGTLSCDGDINVIGTGVLLIDKVELAKGCSFNLLPLKEYYGADGGSVAVFLLQEDGSYMLVNKTVKGVIDERTELPEAVRLVLPADSMLELQAFRVKVETGEDGNKTVIRDLSGNTEELEGENYEYYGGYLCVGDLTLNNRAKIINNKLEDSIAAGIIVGGNLINEGLIRGGSVTVVQKDSGGGGLYSGSGTIEDSFITLRTGQTMSINIKGSTLNLEQGKYTIEQLGLTGKSELYYRDGLKINNLKGASESSLDIYSFDMTDNLTFNRTIDGVDVLIKSGITELAAALEFLNGGKADNETYGSLVFDYRGGSAASDGTDGSVFIGPGTVTVPDPDTETYSIPAVYFNLYETINYSWNIELNENREGQEYEPLENYKPEEEDNGKITYSSLITYYKNIIDKHFPDGLESLREGQSIIFEVLRCKKGKLSMTVLDGSYNGYETDTDGVFLIRMAFLDSWKNSVSGSTVTSTRASQTGSGNIGGNSNSIITGTGITRFSSVDPDPDPVKPDPDPVKPDPVKPDPDPVKPDPVKPDHNPVKPSKEYNVAAVNGSGDTLAILINEFDLNEGDENAGKAPYYSLTAYINGAQVSKLSAPVKVEMDWVLPEEFRDKPLYAVFASEDKNSDETLMAVSAVYDEEAGKLTFETSQVGEFIIVAFEFDGEEFSPEFYDELEKTDEAKLFIKHMEEKKENAGL